jgi:hypothetical protein
MAVIVISVVLEMGRSGKFYAKASTWEEAGVRTVQTHTSLFQFHNEIFTPLSRANEGAPLRDFSSRLYLLIRDDQVRISGNYYCRSHVRKRFHQTEQGPAQLTATGG